MLLGMFIWWITPNGAFWGLIAGMLSSFLMYLAVKFHWFAESIITMSSVQSDMAANFWRAWWAWLICVVVTVGVSMWTKKRPKEELVGLVKGLTKEKHDQDIPFIKRPEFYAIISLIVFILLNIWFW
jgi:SSS family solute:Na+ symporter